MGSRSGIEPFVASEGGTGTNEDFVLSQLKAWLSRQYMLARPRSETFALQGSAVSVVEMAPDLPVE